MKTNKIYSLCLADLRDAIKNDKHIGIKEVCRTRNVSYRSFEYWLYKKQHLSIGKIKEEQSEEPEDTSLKTPSQSMFSPMSISSFPGKSAEPSIAEQVCIKMPNGVTVTLAQISESTLVKTIVSLSQC